ncbi:MAG: peptidylprolyl isomerase [Planctomycetales bacterium]
MRLLLILLSLFIGFSADSGAQEKPLKADQRIILHTQAGDIVLALYPRVAPKHTGQLLELARLGLLNGMHFHRVEPNFVAQTSTAYDRLVPLTSDQRAVLHPIPAEFSGIRHRRGILSMAHSDNQPDSGESSFSILLGDAPHLDGKYTVFGEVEQGIEVLDEFVKVPRRGNAPVIRITIANAEIADLDQLQKLSVAPARPIPVSPNLVSGDNSQPQRQLLVANGILLSSLVLIVIFLVVMVFLSNHITKSQMQSLVIIALLIGSFQMFVFLGPDAARQARNPESHRFLAVALFLGLLGLLKLLGRFESPNNN